MDNKKKAKAKANANRVAAYALSGVMLASMIPYNVFAEMTGTEKATIQAAKELDISSPKIDEAVRETPKKQASDEFTEAKAKENWDQELKDKGYWKLAQGQRFRRVSASDPVSIYDINYDGTFVDAEGNTNLRFIYNELNGVGSGVWHRIVVNFGDLTDKIDFEKSYVVGEDGKTTEKFYDVNGEKRLDITKLYSGPRAGKRVNFPMNIVLKDGKSINEIPKENYIVQLRLVNKARPNVEEGTEIYTYAPKGTSIDYSSYTKVTSVDLSDNISSTVLEGPKQEKGERIAIQRSFMSEFIANPVDYDDSTQIGILRTEYLGNRGGSIGENIKDVDGKPIGFAQVFDAKLVEYLKEDANGNVAYTNVLTNNRKQGSWVKKIGIKNGDINVKNGLAYVVISRLDSVNAFKNNGIKAVGVPTLDQYINQSGIYFSAIDYLIDKTKLNEEFSSGKRKTDFSMAAGWVEPNTKGWTIFEKTFDEEFVVPKGEKYTINTTNVPEGGQVIIQVGDKNQAILRNKQGYYNSTVSFWKQGVDSVDETSPGTYEFTLREGATIKKGEGIRVLLPDTTDHTSPVSFVNQHNADGGTELKVESNSGNIKVTLKNSANGDIKLKYTLKGETEQSEIVYKKKGLSWEKPNDPDNILEGAGKAWITKSKLEPGKKILVEHYDASGRKVDGLESYIIYKELEKSPERYTNIAWVDSTDTLSEVSMRKSLYKPYQVIFTNDYVEGTDDFYKNPRIEPTNGQDFMKNTDKVQGFTKYEGGSIRMRTELIDGEGLLGKVTATENEYDEKDGSIKTDNSEKLTLDGKEYNAYRYIIDLNNLGKISKEGIATRDTEETTETKGEKLVLKKDKKLYFNASDGSSLGSELVETRVRTRVLFDATDGAFEGDKKKEVKIVPDNVKYLDDDGYVASGFTGDNVQAGTGDEFATAPTAQGKTFLGWVTEAGKTKLENKTVTTAAEFEKLTANTEKFTAGTPVERHLVVYAVWSEEKLVTFDANGGQFEDGTTEKSVKTNEDKTVTPPVKNPTRDGKEFVGWASSKTATAAEDGIFKNITDAKTVYAVWKDAAQEESAKPTITEPKAGDTSVSGTGVPGATVVLKDKDGKEIGKATVDKDGKWTVDNIPKDKLVEGEKVTAEQTEKDKKPATEEATVGKAQEESAKPTITEPKAGDTSVSGTGVPGATVVLKDKDGKEIGKATVDKDGKWTVDKIPADKLVQGEKVTAEQTEPGKKPASEEATVAAKAEETSAKPTITEPKAGDTSVSGTGVPGATVVLKDKDGKEIGKATVDKDGNWTVKDIPADKLVEGEKVTAEQTEKDKKPATEEATIAAKTAEETSAQPTILNPKEGATEVTGEGVPGAKIELKDKDGNKIGEATVGEDGKWTVENIPTDKLVKDQVITAVQTEKDKAPAENTAKVLPIDGPVCVLPEVLQKNFEDAANKKFANIKNKEGIYEGTFDQNKKEVTVKILDKTKSFTELKGTGLIAGLTDLYNNNNLVKVQIGSQPIRDLETIRKASPDEATFMQYIAQIVGSDIGVEINGQGSNIKTLNDFVGKKLELKLTIQQKDCDGLQPIDLTYTISGIDAQEESAKPTITEPKAGDTSVSGTGVPGATVVLKDKDGKEIGKATVDKDGNWTVKDIPADKLVEGEKVTAEQTEKDKKPATEEATVGKAQETSAKPTITEPKAGDTSVSGTGVPGATVVLKDKDGNEIGKATVDKDGKWTVDKIPADKLVQGEKVTAEQTEKDKKPATEESTVAAKAAEETSAKPVITEPKAGDTSVSGTGVPGATVVLKDKDGKEIGKATVDKDGNWTVDNIPKDKLVQGEKVTAEQTEPGKKPATEEATVAKAQETSAKPTITEPKAGDTSVSGTGVPGATVVLKDKDGKEIGKATVDKDGKWTVDKIPADKLVQGEKVTAEQTEKDKKPATEEATVGKAQEESAKPTITEPKAGDTSVSGTGVPGATVVLKDKDGKEIGKATVDKDGKWTVDNIPKDKLVEGEKVTAEQTEKDKKPATEEATVGKTVDKAPLQAEVDKNKDDAIKGSDKYKNADQDKKDAYDKALEEAQKVLDNKDATQEEVNKAKDALKAAEDALNGKTTTSEDKHTTVTGEAEPVDPTDEKQGTGIKVTNPDDKTKITAEDEDGKDVPVAIDPITGEIEVTPGTDVDGPIVVTIEDPDLPGGKTTIIIDVVGHSMLRDDNGNGYIGENGYNPDNNYHIFPGGIVEHDYTPTHPVKTVVPEKTIAVTPVHDTLWYVFHINEYEYEVVRNGVVTKRLMDVTPVLRNNRTMLPLRYVAEAIGADVKWDAKTRTATFTKDGLTASIQVDGNEIVLSNGKVIKMDSKPLMLNNRILVSVVNVANVFGLTNGNTLDGSDQDIEWQQEDKSATIYIRR